MRLSYALEQKEKNEESIVHPPTPTTARKPAIKTNKKLLFRKMINLLRAGLPCSSEIL